MTAALTRNAGRAAAAIGCTVDEYVAHVDAGEKWCTKCKRWQARSEFGRDSSRGDGLTTSCRVAKNGHPDYDTPTGRPRGRRRCPRDGDRVQARRWVHHLVGLGVLAPADSQPCVDCSHGRGDVALSHQFDHFLGYAAEHHGDVQVVCTACHYAREMARGAHDNARRMGRRPSITPVADDVQEDLSAVD